MTPTTAARLGERLIDEALRLSTLPKRHAFIDKRRKIWKMPLAPFLVHYQVDATARLVYILHFWHGARKPPRFEG